MTTKYGRFVFLGVGGGWLTPRILAFFLSYYMSSSEIVIADGGVYEFRQRDHEHFELPGNKARIEAEYLRSTFPELKVAAIPRYVGPRTTEEVIAVQELIQPEDVVFLQVDNNDTRKLVDEYAGSLESTTVLCGGTNEDQLRVLVHIRRKHADITPPFSSYCREIRNPTDESPARRLLRRDGCVENLGQSERFQPFTMLTTSTLLLNAFYKIWKLESAGHLASFPYCELWYDIGNGKCRTEKWISIKHE